MANSPQLKAGGNISVSRFVKGGSADYEVVQCDTQGETALGVAYEGAQDAPIPSASALAAADGDNLRIYQWGETCHVSVGADLTRFTPATTDANGEAEPALTGDYTLFMPYESVTDASGGLCFGMVMFPAKLN